MGIPRRVKVLLLLLPSLTAAADEASWDLSGNLDLASRLFSQDTLWPGQNRDTAQFSAAATAELRWRSASGEQRLSLIPHLRWDSVDDERSLADLREAYWAGEGDAHELLIGANTVFWGVTESVHLVDIINQTDTVADIDGEDKLGQPMVSLAVQRDWGEVTFYVLPYFRERTFPGLDGRFRPGSPIDTDRAVYESSAGRNHVDLALRYNHYIGDVDIGLSVFSGTSREPRLVPAADSNSLLPHYDQIDQFGLDLQYTRDAWLWKLESIVRDGYAETFAAAVGGFEYTFYQVYGSAADIGVLLEYQYDGRGEQEPLVLSDNDLFMGLRLAMNDVQDATLLAGIAYDTDTGETFVNLEAERRFGERLFAELRARALAGAAPEDNGYAFSSDDYVELQVGLYF